MIPGLALFGGSFNPPHLTHRRILETALEELDLTEIQVVPTGHHPHKQDEQMASPEHRLQMCHLAFDDLERVRVVDLEMRRRGPSYTSDTLAQIRGGLPADEPLYYLLGSDNLPLLPTWHEPEKILALSTVVTFPRGGAPLDPSVLDDLGLSDKEQRRFLGRALRMDPDAVSSTDIRRLVAAGPGPIPELDPRVEAYIREHQLYGS